MASENQKIILVIGGTGAQGGAVVRGMHHIFYN
jgi:hypothetical protein